jgi:hypothetical protein
MLVKEKKLRSEDRLDYFMGKEGIILLDIISQTRGKDSSEADSQRKRSDCILFLGFPPQLL